MRGEPHRKGRNGRILVSGVTLQGEAESAFWGRTMHPQFPMSEGKSMQPYRRYFGFICKELYCYYVYRVIMTPEHLSGER